MGRVFTTFGVGIVLVFAISHRLFGLFVKIQTPSIGFFYMPTPFVDRSLLPTDDMLIIITFIIFQEVRPASFPAQ